MVETCHLVNFYRFLPTASGLLPCLDMPGRPLLHCFHHAPLHYLSGQVPLTPLPDEVRTKQDPPEGHTQDHLRLAPVHRNESSSQPHVFSGTNPILHVYFRL